MTTCLGKSCSFGLPWVPFVNCFQFMYLVVFLLFLRAGCGIWLYQFLIIAYLFTLDMQCYQIKAYKQSIKFEKNEIEKFRSSSQDAFLPTPLMRKFSLKNAREYRGLILFLRVSIPFIVMKMGTIIFRIHICITNNKTRSKGKFNEAMIWKHIRIVYIKWRNIRQKFCVDNTIVYQAAAPATYISTNSRHSYMY